MDMRLITTSRWFKLLRLVVPQHVLLHWFGRRATVVAAGIRVR
jgi:hypothetical protein